MAFQSASDFKTTKRKAGLALRRVFAFRSAIAGAARVAVRGAWLTPVKNTDF
jgi:hypothetical protein